MPMRKKKQMRLSFGTRICLARRFLFFQAEPTKKLPEFARFPAENGAWTDILGAAGAKTTLDFGRLGQLGQLFSRSGEQMRIFLSPTSMGDQS